MKNSKIIVWLVIALLCLSVGVLAKGGRSGGRSSSGRRSSSRSSSSGSSSSYGSSRSSYSPSSSSWNSSSRSSSSSGYSSRRSSYSPSSSSSYNSNTASNKGTSDGSMWKSIKNFFGFGSSNGSSSSSSNQSKNIPIPTSNSITSPSHSISSSTNTDQRTSSISGNTLNTDQRLSHAPSESDNRNLNVRRNVTSSASSASNLPSRLFNGSPVLNGTLYNRPSSVHSNIPASNVAMVQSLNNAPLAATSASNHNQDSAPSNGRFWSYYGGPYYNGGLHHTHSYHSGNSWHNSEGSSDDSTPDPYYTSSGYSSGTGTASYVSVDGENNDENSGKLRIQNTCTEILNSVGRISELLRKICSPYATNNTSSRTTAITPTPNTGVPTAETTVSPTTLTPHTSADVQGTEPPKKVCRKVQQSALDEQGKLVENIKEICEPDTTTIPPTISSRPAEITTTLKPEVEPTLAIILPPTLDAR